MRNLIRRNQPGYGGAAGYNPRSELALAFHEEARSKQVDQRYEIARKFQDWKERHAEKQHALNVAAGEREGERVDIQREQMLIGQEQFGKTFGLKEQNLEEQRKYRDWLKERWATETALNTYGAKPGFYGKKAMEEVGELVGLTPDKDTLPGTQKTQAGVIGTPSLYNRRGKSLRVGSVNFDTRRSAGFLPWKNQRRSLFS